MDNRVEILQKNDPELELLRAQLKEITDALPNPELNCSGIVKDKFGNIKQ